MFKLFFPRYNIFYFLRCDIYEEKSKEDLKQLISGFTRYIEILNKMRRPQTTRQQKAKVITSIL